MKWSWRRLPLGVMIYCTMVAVLLLSGFVFYRTFQAHHPTGRFTILQINDVYKVEGIQRETIGGLARVRALRESLEKEGRPVLMLHAGDFLYPSVMSKFLAARPMVRCLNLLDGKPNAFDDRLVVTFGNHEFDKEASKDILTGRIMESDFRWVTSNVLFRDKEEDAGQLPSQRFKNVSEDLILELDGIKVGIFAITTPGEKQPWADYRWDLRYRLVREALGRLQKQGAQVLIALTHEDIADDRHLAELFPEIDLIVGGHDHFHMEERIGHHTLITKADADARSAVRIDVAVLDDGHVMAVPEKIDLGLKFPKDPAMNTAVQQARNELARTYEQDQKRKLDEPFAQTENFLEGVEPAVRGRETALGNLLTDSIREQMKTQVAFLNGGAIRINDNIPAKGTITREDLEGIFYYPNKLVSFKLSPEELVGLLQNSISQVDQGSGRFLQVSCIHFRYRKKPNTDPAVYEVGMNDVRICPEGHSNAPISEWMPLSQVPENEKITASTVEYLWKNGYKEGYNLFAEGKGGKSPAAQKEERPDWRPVFERQFQGKPISTKVEGRIQRMEG